MGKKYKKCKVEYVDNLETNFEVNCAEIKATKYRIYARTNGSDWKLLTKKKDKQKAIDYANNLNPNIYNDKIVIEYDEETNSEFPVDLER